MHPACGSKCDEMACQMNADTPPPALVDADSLRVREYYFSMPPLYSLLPCVGNGCISYFLLGCFILKDGFYDGCLIIILCCCVKGRLERCSCNFILGLG